MPEQDRLYTTEEAARLLTTRKTTLECWRTRGVGPMIIRLVHVIRYRQSDLTQFVERGTRQTTAANGR